MFSNWNLRRKIVLLATSSTVIVCGILFYLHYRETGEQTRHEYVARARSIVLTAESVREEMARKWKLGLFDQRQLVAWAHRGEVDKVLGAVPVVTAWTAAMAKSKEGRYDLRVPKFHPRNRQNQPDELETRVLQKFAAESQLTEHFEIDPASNSVRFFRPIRLTSECLLCHGDPARSQELWGNARRLDPTGGPMEGWKEGEVHGAFEVVQSLDEADARVAASLRQQAAIVLGLVAVSGTVLFLLVTRSICNPIRETVAAFQRFAAGDLRHSLEASARDEIGTLRRAANELMEKLRGMISRMESCAGRLKDSSSSLLVRAETLASGAAETTQQSGAVSAAAEQMAVTMQNMAQSTERMSANVETVTTSVGEMTTAITEVASSAEMAARVADKAARLAETTNDRVTQLGRAAGEIDDVVDFIQEVAEQTRLLALNATIEAARAGEAGKGFSVVATEVKQLARQTAEATERIRGRVEAMQHSSTEAVAAIREIDQVVGEVNGASRTIASAVEEQSVTMRQIAQHVADTSADARSVAVGIAETSVAAGEVTRSISRVDTNARQTASNASHTQSAGGELADLAEQLNNLVHEFQTA